MSSFPSPPPSSKNNLVAELGSPPVSTLGVVPDGVAGSEPDPLWDWPVLLHGPAHLGLDLERLVRRP